MVFVVACIFTVVVEAIVTTAVQVIFTVFPDTLAIPCDEEA